MGIKWLTRPVSTERQSSEDAVAWARKETIAFAWWKYRIWGAAFVLGCILVAPFLAGIPAHHYWLWMGLPILLATTFCFVPLGFHAAVLMSELWRNPQDSNKGRSRHRQR
jgi:hypothetical protein